jgi:hypothetical protein
MSRLRLLAVLLSAASLTACLDSTTLVKLKPDGSGTIEQTTLVNTAALKGMMPGASGQANTPMSNREELERTAAKMGKGVKLVSTEPVKSASGFEGTKATFSFEDINLIELSQDPSLGGGTDSMRVSSSSSEAPVKFNLTRNGGTSTLAINFTDKPVGTSKPADAAAAPSEMPDFTNPMIMGMIKTMFQGFKINIALEVVGSILKTNAEYVDGPRITLLEMDMGALLADEAKLKALQGKIAPGASFSDVKPYLKDIRGIKIDGPAITVQFR